MWGKIEVRFLFMVYSLGVRVHPPLYIGRFEDGMSSFAKPNNVVELVYNGRVCGGMAKEKAQPAAVEKYNNRKTKAALSKCICEVVSIF